MEWSGKHKILHLLRAWTYWTDKFVWPYKKSRQNLSLRNFLFVKRGRTETQQNICYPHVSITWDKSLHRNVRRFFGSIKLAGVIDGTHKNKGPKQSAVDYFSRYKLNSTWPWRCSWNVNLGTVIVVFWVRIVMQHSKVRIFHLHRWLPRN